MSIEFLNDEGEIQAEAHQNCRCVYVRMRTKAIGTATDLGLDGADAYLMYVHQLPDYYITKIEAKRVGWIGKQGNLSEVLPGKMIGGDVYRNYDGKLPASPGRTWHEADLNYT